MRRGRTRIVLLLAIVVAAAAPPAAASEIEALQKQLSEAEIAVEMLLRSHPTELDMESEARFVKALAEQAEIEAAVTAVAGAEVVPLDDGKPSPMRMHRTEVSGRGSTDGLASFVRFMSKGTRTRYVESLRFEPRGDSRGVFVVRYALPVYVPESPAPANVGSPREREAELRQRVNEAQALHALLERMQDAALGGNGEAATGLLEAIAGQRGLGSTAVRVGESIVLEGAIVGAAARAALVASLNDRGLRVARLRTPLEGACRPFAMTLTRDDVEAVIERASASSFSRESAALCAVEPRPALGRVALRGAAGGAKSITMRMRGADIKHLFMALNVTTDEDFLVDPGLRGTVDVELEGATFEETVAELGKLGVVVGDGPLRYVSRSAAPALSKPDVSHSGEPMSFSFDDAPLGDLLCLIEGIFGLEMNVAPNVASRITIYATEQPWDRMLEAMIRSSRLDYVIEGTRVFVGPENAVKAGSRGTWRRACEALDSAGVLADFRPRADELDPADLTLAGVVKTTDGWSAYAYGPWRQLVPLAKDQPLFRGKVTAVGREGMTALGERTGTVTFRLGE